MVGLAAKLVEWDRQHGTYFIYTLFSVGSLQLRLRRRQMFPVRPDDTRGLSVMHSEKKAGQQLGALFGSP